MKYLANLLACSSILILTTLLSCNDDETVVETPSATFESDANINPANFPAGVGLDLNAADTGRVAQLDVEANLPFDLSILTIRTGMGGRPGVFLFGDVETNGAVSALNISEFANVGLGQVGFESFETVTAAMQSALTADGVFNFDPAVDIDGEGNPDASALAQAYQSLVIGDRVIRLDAAEQPVFLVRDREGLFHKFQFVMLANGGNITLRWSRFNNNNIE